MRGKRDDLADQIGSGRDRTGVGVRMAAIASLSALGIVWTILALDLTRQLSPTIDEVPHAAAGWAIREAGDFRVNPEHPPLWKWLSALPHRESALQADFDSPIWRAMLSSYDLEWIWSANLLYRDAPSNGVRYIRRARPVIVGFGLLAGAIVVLWSWRLAGPYAAVLAATLFTIEPTILAHSSLLTSDAPFTATFCLTLYLCGSSRRASWRVPAIGGAVGLALATKFTALILPPALFLLFTLRAWLRREWKRPVIELAVVALVAWGTLWAAYGFRFTPSPGGELLDLSRALRFLEHKSVVAAVSPESLTLSAATLAERVHLLPQAYSVGLIWAKATSLGQPAYLLGEISSRGWWFYFPFALAVKVATVLLLAGLLALILVPRTRQSLRVDAFELASLLIAPLLLFLVAIVSRLNIGVRHVLPVIPILIILISVVIARAIEERRLRAVVLIVLLLGGTVELAATHPFELSYFNRFAGGAGRGIALLGDSNLDWGQDLGRLGRWHDAHPCTKIHLAYYGSTPPEAYGIVYEPLPVREEDPVLPPPETSEDEVLIVSSRYLQGFELTETIRPFYALLREREPDELIGTTLYVFRIGPQASCAGG